MSYCLGSLQIYDNDVDDASPHKQYWLEELRANVLRCFDISEPNWSKQDPTVLPTVWAMMAAGWSYEGGDLSMKKFSSHCRSILKRERHKMHTYWQKKCKCDRGKPGPVHLDPAKWARLVDHFTSPTLVNKSAEMAAKRSRVQNTSQFGRGGAWAATKKG